MINTTFSKRLLSSLGGATRLAARRALTTTHIGSDPLDLWQKECHARHLCDDDGLRVADHWTMAVSVSDGVGAPSLRTVGIQRLSTSGVDFCWSKNASQMLLNAATPLSILHTYGQYKIGEKVEQWRGQGTCVAMQLTEILDVIPSYTLIGMVGSARLAQDDNTSHAHVTEVMQMTRRDLEEGAISQDELEASVQALRFEPNRIECMTGGPDTLFWERYEWNRDDNGEWMDPQYLIPH